ncbi:MAG: hypothetical protein COW65_17435 [Cytophagales bacterium CG18_big_fil_WC_8_21_14_2_50_42_9]|nr:MAG: hypothetical protein COW65_17435 [Cytophagales bacterium CG18_big_fil_WC_8_21_14_2_50_42_9]
MNNLRLLCWALSFVIFFSSCKKNTVPLTSSASETPASQTKNLNFQYFSAKGKMQLEEKNSKVSSGVTVRMLRDSVIWISVVPGFGIEAARLKITTDSVYMLNRLQHNYFAGDYTLIKDKFKVDVNFKLVQAILLGNYLPSATGNEKKLADAPLQHLRQEQENLLIDQFLDASTSKLKKLTIKDQQTKNSINVDYAQFEQVNDQPFAKNSLIVVQQSQGEKNAGAIVSIEYNKVNLDEEVLDFPFSVPSGYTRK